MTATEAMAILKTGRAAIRRRNFNGEWAYSDNKDVNERVGLACRALLNDYCRASVSFEDAITEIADGITPVYTWELCRACADIRDYADMAVNEGLYYADAENFSLDRLLMVGYCLFIENALRENLDDIKTEMAIEACRDADNDGELFKRLCTFFEDFQGTCEAGRLGDDEAGSEIIRDFIDGMIEYCENSDDCLICDFYGGMEERFEELKETLNGYPTEGEDE